MKRYLAIFCISVFVFVSCGGPTLPSQNLQGGGFSIETWYIGPGYPLAPVGGVTISASWVSDFDYTAAGDPRSFTVITDSEGLAEAGGRELRQRGILRGWAADRIRSVPWLRTTRKKPW